MRLAKAQVYEVYTSHTTFITTLTEKGSRITEQAGVPSTWEAFHMGNGLTFLYNLS